MSKLITRLLCLLPVVILVVTLNYTQDPARLFNTVIEHQISDAMRDGSNFELYPSNYNERMVQRLFIQSNESDVDIVTIGSSRAMQVDSALFQNQTFQNHSVSGATIEDIVAIFYMYLEQDNLPDHIILGLDPWMLNANNGQTRWTTLDTEYRGFLNIINLGGDTFSTQNQLLTAIDTRYFELFSPTYFQASLRHLLNNLVNPEEFAPVARRTTATISNNTIRLTDGAISYPAIIRDRTSEQVAEIAAQYTQDTPVYSLGNFVEIDPELSHIMESFINYLLLNNIEITILLSPYHPVTYDRLINQTEYRIIEDVENYYRQFAITHNIRLIGSFDPMIAGCDENEFYDAMHPKYSCIQHIFSQFIQQN